jgi:O-acetyl-ADP-ribose deacetylase (regulator of RNase III)
MDVRVVQGDIAQQSADALVTAAGTSLRMGSGAGGVLGRVGCEALHSAAAASGVESV